MLRYSYANVLQGYVRPGLCSTSTIFPGQRLTLLYGGWDSYTGDVYIRDTQLTFDSPGETTKTVIHEGWHDYAGPSTPSNRTYYESLASASEEMCII